MSAPVTERPRGGTATRSGGRVTAKKPTAKKATLGGRTATVPPQRGTGLPTIPAQRGQSRAGAAQRAYARRDDRVRRLVGARPGRTAAPAGRAQFILLVMVLLGAGLVATLWLSTAAAQDSYRLQDARDQARTLTEQSERLRREVTSMEAAPALAQRAAALGLVPVQDPARLVVGPDGAVQVVGDPVAAAPGAPPVAPPPDVAAAPAVSAEAATQAQPDPAAAPAAQPGAAAPNAPAAAGQPAGQAGQPAPGGAG
ncbi:hypothetical protein [Pseudonocardia acidicola]|uniref:Cell division protein FtsL n=1 Tax=Pseudonocardia acidicola TaxID=2724939 RepID=A0ABX1SFB1_9PSEU|nr:hypothetical protein [Pseudonocardia acidicola]NMI00236.1 hypothetical protein [Pseudonocardia acidicola]